MAYRDLLFWRLCLLGECGSAPVVSPLQEQPLEAQVLLVSPLLLSFSLAPGSPGTAGAWGIRVLQTSTAGYGEQKWQDSTVVFPYLLPSVLKRKALHVDKTDKMLLYCFNINSLIGKGVSDSPQCMVRPFFPALLTPCISSDLCGLMEVVFCCLALPFPALHSSALCFGLGLQASLRSFPPDFWVPAQSLALVLTFS